MGYWIELRCDRGSSTTCLSSRNVGPMHMASSSGEGVRTIVAMINRDAKHSGWTRMAGEGWVCPACHGVPPQKASALNPNAVKPLTPDASTTAKPDDKAPLLRARLKIGSRFVACYRAGPFKPITPYVEALLAAVGVKVDSRGVPEPPVELKIRYSYHSIGGTVFVIDPVNVPKQGTLIKVESSFWRVKDTIHRRIPEWLTRFHGRGTTITVFPVESRERAI